MIPLGLRITLMVICLLVLVFVLRKIRSSKLNIVDSIFWIVVCVVLILMAVFPQLPYFFARLLGIQTPLNFILILIIAILLLKVFLMTLQISEQNERIKKLAQKIAIDEFEREEDKRQDKNS